MARKRKKSPATRTDGWLITFSDLITLLLTFFVLLLSMSSMERTILTRISTHFASHTNTENAAGRIPTSIREVLELLRDLDTIFEKQERIKDLLFPDEVLPADMSRGELHKNIAILEHPEGVVIVLTEALLFDAGAARLNSAGKKLLEALTPVILAAESDVNISGHTDSTEAVGAAAYTLGGQRALAALEQFLLGQVKPSRFSVSSYGADKPFTANATQEGRSRNRRIEILLKTTRWIGKYN